MSELLTKENVKETIEELRADKECDADLRMHAILNMLSTSSDASALRKHVEKELKIRADKKALDDRKAEEKTIFAVIRTPKTRDGKIHFSYNDMKAYRKSALDKHFNSRGDWLSKRERKFESAGSFWKKVESMDASEKEKVMSAINWNVARLKPEKHLKELAESLNKIVGEKVDDYITEILAFNNHDLLFSHGGAAQDVFFEYDESKYAKKMAVLAKRVKKNTDFLEKGIKDYPEEVKNELREKLLPLYLSFNTEFAEKSSELDKEVRQLKSDIEQEKNKKDSADKKQIEKLEKKLALAQKRLKKAKDSATMEKAANKKATGYETMEDLMKVVNSNISGAEGVMSDKMSEFAERYEKRKDMLMSYGKGELKPIADWLFDQQSLREVLLDPAESVASKKIGDLHANLSAFANVYKTQFSLIGQVFLEQNGSMLLGLSEPMTEKQWNEQFESFTSNYVATGKEGINSIQQNFELLQTRLEDSFTKYYFETKEVKDDVRKSGSKDPGAKYRKATSYARGTAASIFVAVRDDEELFEQMFNERSVKNLAKKIGENYMANEKEMKKAFNAYLSKNKAVASADAASDLQLFIGHLRVKAIKEDKAEFKKHLKKYLQDYVSGIKIGTFAHTALIKSSEKRLAEKKAKSKPAIDDMINKSYETRLAMNNVLFGGNLDSINQFSSQKRSLAYEHTKSNKKIKTRGKEDDARLRAAAKSVLEKVGQGKEVPQILVNVLDEYMRFNSGIMDKIDKLADWILKEKNEIVLEAERLFKVYEYGKEQGIPEAGLELYTVYTIRNSERGFDSGMKDAAKQFKTFFTKFSELEGIAVSNPLIKAQKKDAMEKMRMLLFIKGEGLSKDALDKMVDAQKAYLAYADKAYTLIQKAAEENEDIKKFDSMFKERYIKGACDYFGGEFINESAAGKTIDEAAFKTKIKELFADKIRREALITREDGITSANLAERTGFTGALGQKDFEKLVVKMNEPTLLKAYNGLNDDQKEMLAVALYTMRVEDTGTMCVLYGEHADELKTNRDLMAKYMRGENVSFDVDYGRAIRAFDIRNTDSKDMFDKEIFREAYDFVQMLEKRKVVAKKKDWARLGDPEENVKSAFEHAKNGNLKEEYEKAQKTSTTKAGFLSTLNKFALEDLNKQQKQKVVDLVKKGVEDFKNNSNISFVTKRLSNLQPHQQRLLIFVLQDRTVLDYSTGGRGQDTKIWGFANDVKRAALIDRLKTPSEKEKAIEAATEPDVIRTAMATLMSYQLKDHEDVSEGGYSKSDYASDALNRIETIDWALLSRAIDLVDEIEAEQRRLLAVRQASKWLTEDLDKEDRSPAKETYRRHKDAMKLSGRTKFEEFFIETGRTDAAINGADSEEIDTLLEGYLSLTDEEKALFVRALEHRDILDVSQKNLYRNFMGTAERDYVNAKGRDELIDEFLETTYGAEGHVNLKEDSYEKAFVSLLTTQVNDDMDFAKAKGLDWTNKNMYTNNQIFVTKRKTSIDWDLFRNALRFVHTTVAERDQARGDEEIYRSMGDVTTYGRMNFDRRFMRSNLKRTGNRIIRKITHVVLGEAAANVPYVDKLFEYEDIIDQIAPVKTSNYIHQYVGEFKQFRGQYEKLWEENKTEEQQQQQDAPQEEAEKDPYELTFLNNLGKLVDLGRSNVDTVKGIKKQVKDKYYDTKEFLLGKKESKEDELSKQLKEVGGDYVPLKLERNDILDRAQRDFVQKAKDLTHYDKLLKKKDEFIERVGEVNRDIVQNNVIVKNYNKTVGLVDDLKEDIKLKVNEKVDEYKADLIKKKDELVEEYLEDTKPYKAYTTVAKYGGEVLKAKKEVDDFLEKTPFAKKLVDDYVVNKIMNSYVAEKMTGWYKSGTDWVSAKKDSAVNLITNNAVTEFAGKTEQKINDIQGKIGEKITDAANLSQKGKEKLELLGKKAAHFVLEDMIPDAVKSALDEAIGLASKSKEFLEKSQKFVGEKLALLDTFKDYYNIGKDIFESGKNIYTLNKKEEEAKEKHDSDVKKVDESMENRDEEQEELVRQHQQTTIDLLLKSNSLTKYAQGRKMVIKSGELASKIMSNFAPTKVIAKVLPVAIEMATFMSQCLTDHNALIKWYDGPGQATVKKILSGQKALKAYDDSKKLETLEDKITEKSEPLPMLNDKITSDDPDAKIAVDRKVLSKVKYAMGFTREEELMDFMGLKMVDSLLFAASDYNPLEEPQILAKCTLTVLGLDSCIGKTDSDTAMKVFRALKK